MKTRSMVTLNSALFAAILIFTMSACGQTNKNVNSDPSSGVYPSSQSQAVAEQPYNIASALSAVEEITGPFSLASLKGKWSISLFDNGNKGSGWAYLQIDINERGEPTCLEYDSSNGYSLCEAMSPLPTISIRPDGLISIPGASIYGTMDYDGHTAYLEKITADGVEQTGVMTRAANDFNRANLAGKWTVMLLDNLDSGNGWTYLKMSVNKYGETTCIDYRDSNEITSCENAPQLPTIYINPDGTIYTDGAKVYGLMNYDKTVAYLSVVNETGVAQTGTMTKTSEDFDVANLKGVWTLTLLNNGSEAYGWKYLKMSVNELGEPTCLTYLDSTGSNSCATVEPLPTLSINKDGVISTGNANVYGLMDHDRTAAHIAKMTSNDVLWTGTMTKTLNTFEPTDLKGRWNLTSFKNGFDGYGWFYLKMEVSETGEVACLAYLDSYGLNSCDDFSPMTITIRPDGLVISSSGNFYGVMDYNRTTVHIGQLNDNGIIQTGIMTKATNGSDIGNMAGKWTAFLNGNGNEGFGWRVLNMDVNEDGQATCLSSVDSNNNNSCSDLPDISIRPDGIVSAANASIYGLLDYDETTVYLAGISVEGVAHTGIMTKSSDNFEIASLVGAWTINLTDNANPGFGWKYLTVSINGNGETGCLQYLDSNGNNDCSAIEQMPTISIQPNGLINIGNTSLHGIMNYDRTSAFLTGISADGVTQTGSMTRR